jgi:hypothetical protein
MVLCRDPLATALTAAVSARRSTAATQSSTTATTLRDTRSATVESMNSTQSQVPDGQSGKTGSFLARTTSLRKDVQWGLACSCLRRAYPDVDIGRTVMGDRRSGIARVCHHLPDFGLQPLIGGERLGISRGPNMAPPSRKRLLSPKAGRARVARKSSGRHRKLHGAQSRGMEPRPRLSPRLIHNGRYPLHAPGGSVT